MCRWCCYFVAFKAHILHICACFCLSEQASNFSLTARKPFVAKLIKVRISSQVSQNNLGLRHWCDQNDDLKSYGWLKHDGATFGYQEIVDRGLNITTSFVKRNRDDDDDADDAEDWTARIEVDVADGIKKQKR